MVLQIRSQPSRSLAGENVFRAASIFTQDSTPSTQPDQESSKHFGSWLRSQSCKHLERHHKRFSVCYETQSEWQTWLKNVGKQNTYVDGKIIQAFSEKQGQSVVVWKQDTEDSTVTWARFVVATRFSQGFACAARNKSVVCVILSNKHYVALVHPPGADVPMSWLRETPNQVISLDGGGPSDESPAKCQKNDEDSCDTPSVHTPASSHKHGHDMDNDIECHTPPFTLWPRLAPPPPFPLMLSHFR